MVVVSQTTFSGALSWMKRLEYWLEFHWILFLRVQLTQHCFRYGLAPNTRQAIIWTNADPIHWRICGTRGRWVKCPNKRPARFSGCEKIMKINSLWPSDAIRRCRSGSTLAQVMAYCLTAPSHYLNQCWRFISKVHWHSYEGNLSPITNITLKITFPSNLPGANGLKLLFNFPLKFSPMHTYQLTYGPSVVV